jgi:Putative Flp pilus-assembly TadE/G-like
MGTALMSDRKGERGVTILIVAVAMIAMLAMLALAVDIVSLYVAEGDAQRAADAAALAGAKAFVSSGFTSGQLGDPTSGTAQDQVCNGSTGLADLQAQAVAAPNLIAGAAATSVTTSCTFPINNPQITVTVQRTGLPSFFARIWGSRIISVSRSAKAEAYNPSGQSVPIQVHSVKPWLIPNGTPNFYFNTTTYNMFNNGSAFIGQPPAKFTLNPNLTAPPPAPTPTAVLFYAIDIPISPPTPVCPPTSAVSCSNLGTGGSTRRDYEENIACSGMYSVKSTDQIDPSSPITMIDPVKGQIKNGQATIAGTQCLIHADPGSVAPGSGQDTINPSAVGTPVTISGGYNNPNPALQNALSISRSDSVVTVPVYDDKGVAPCTGNPPVCNQQLQIIGFLQLGIQYVDGSGNVYAVILNAAGSNPANSGTTPLPAGWLDSANFRHVNEAAPVPVRLIQ